MPNGNFIKLYRQLLDNPVVCKDGDHLAIWVYILLKATHTERPHMFHGKKITLVPGQFTTARSLIASDLNISESKVQRVLKTLEIEQQIEQRMSNEKRLITVLNWHKYQSSEQPNEHPVNSDRTASEQRVNTQQECKKIKNEKNERNIYTGLLETAIKSFTEHRNKLKKPMTDHAIDLLKKHLEEMASTEEEQIAILNQSIEKGWSDVYELKNKAAPKTEIPEQYLNWGKS